MQLGLHTIIITFFIKYDIICKTFIETKKIKKSKYYIIDTTLICNKGSVDNIGYNI